MAGTPRQRLDTSIPHPARIWDYWLGGTDNFPADREVAALIEAVMPDLPINARAERRFIGRTIGLLAGELGGWGWSSSSPTTPWRSTACTP